MHPHPYPGPFQLNGYSSVVTKLLDVVLAAMAPSGGLLCSTHVQDRFGIICGRLRQLWQVGVETLMDCQLNVKQVSSTIQ